MVLSLKQSKSDMYRAGSLIYIAKADNHNASCCPFVLAKRYINQLNQFKAKPDTVLFCNITTTIRPNSLIQGRSLLAKTVVPYHAMLRRLREALTPLIDNPNNLSLHSFRSGGATLAHTLGFSISSISSHGRWNSSCVNRYIQKDTKSKLLITQTMNSTM
jgi:hypothetical protein